MNSKTLDEFRWTLRRTCLIISCLACSSWTAGTTSYWESKVFAIVATRSTVDDSDAVTGVGSCKFGVVNPVSSSVNIVE